MHLRVLIPLALGFVATLLLCARAVDRLMQRHYALVSRILLGFVISSALTIFPTSFTGPVQVLLCVLCFAAGFAIAHQMDAGGHRTA